MLTSSLLLYVERRMKYLLHMIGRPGSFFVGSDDPFVSPTPYGFTQQNDITLIGTNQNTNAKSR